MKTQEKVISRHRSVVREWLASAIFLVAVTAVLGLLVASGTRGAAFNCKIWPVSIFVTR
jgi:hypothetical protein